MTKDGRVINFLQDPLMIYLAWGFIGILLSLVGYLFHAVVSMMKNMALQFEMKLQEIKQDQRNSEKEMSDLLRELAQKVNIAIGEFEMVKQWMGKFIDVKH